MIRAIKSPKEVANAIPEAARCVLLGECTHGTEEFYRFRAEITKHLIATRGFTLVCVEADWPYMWHINEHIHRRRTKMYPDRIKFPEWMWQNQQFLNLAKWLRKGGFDDVNVFGMDCYSKDESLIELLRYLDAYNPTLAKRVRYSSPAEWPKLLSRLQWKGDRHGSMPAADSKVAGTPSRFETFSAEQNLECMIAAEEYYAKQKLEPPGSRASWNARDQHMVTTLVRVKELLDNPKVIVWAHNSHIGDCTGTPTGGADFQRNETWNVGQMCRSVLEAVHIVGFYSYEGTVHAADRWGGQGRRMTLQPAFPNSFEGVMHGIVSSAKSGPWALLQTEKEYKNDPESKVEDQFAFVEYPLDQEYVILHPHVLCNEGLDVSASVEVSKSIMRSYPDCRFMAVERGRTKSGTVRLKSEKGHWITEYTPHRSVTLHCLPASHRHFSLLKGDGADLITSPEVAKHVLSFPILQRWVGVQYHPKTEFESHYGEVVMGRCYDSVVFIDKTTALDTSVEVKAAPGGPVLSQAGLKRLMKEYKAIMKEPAINLHVHPLEDNILEWHFVITGSQGPYNNGQYHGTLEFPATYPMSPPAIRMLTPSGRFETNTRICMSMSDYHSELWNPAWTVQAILVGLQSFMYEESNQIGGIRASSAVRRRLAKASLAFNMRNEIYVRLFCGEDGARNPKKKKSDVDPSKDEPVCRFCHMADEKELVRPCACKGSSQYVHLVCLQQWQKTVLLTQSTHTRYQTDIDTTCNVCGVEFRYKGKSRREQILEYTGPEMERRIIPGNLIVTSRHSSERNVDTAARYPHIADELAHWTEAVMVIVRGSTADGAYCVAVSVSRPLLSLKERFRASRMALWKREWQPLLKRHSDAVADVEHFIGGPCQPDEPVAMMELRLGPAGAEAKGDQAAKQASRAKKAPKLSLGLVKCFAKTGALHFGKIRDMLLVATKWHKATGLSVQLKVFWGYASWGGTQLLGELGRRSWGLSEQWEERDGMVGLAQGKLQWADVVDHMSIAAASEYSRDE